MTSRERSARFAATADSLLSRLGAPVTLTVAGGDVSTHGVIVQSFDEVDDGPTGIWAEEADILFSSKDADGNPLDLDGAVSAVVQFDGDQRRRIDGVVPLRPLGVTVAYHARMST